MRPSSLSTLAIRVLLIIFVANPTYAQSFFKNGYIVVTSGDTLRGELRERSAQAVDFRDKSDSPIQAYTPEQLIGYHAEDGNHLAVSLTEAGQTTRYFMHEQIKGHVSLYSLFKAEGRLTHAIRLPDKTFIPLRGNLALLMLTNNLTECTNPNFTRLLNLQSFVPGNSQFERVVKVYNACVNPSQSIEKPKRKLQYEAGLLVGFVQNSWKYSTLEDKSSPYWKPNGVYTPTYTTALGGFFSIVPRKRLSVSVEVIFTQYKGSRVVGINNPLDPTDDRSRLYSFAESYFALPIIGRYVFSTGLVRWYLKGGVVPTLATEIQGSYSGSYSAMTVDNVNIPIRAGIGVGYLAGAGVNIKLGRKRQLYIEVRTMPHLVMDRVTRMANSRSLQLMVSVPLIER